MTLLPKILQIICLIKGKTISGDILKTKDIKTAAVDFGIGSIIGFINGIFGAGGGMIAVPFLIKKGFEQKDAQRNAIAVILPISVISVLLYIQKKKVGLFDAVPYLPTGIIGAFVGTCLLSKISPKLLKGIFGGFMIYAGVRLLIR